MGGVAEPPKRPAPRTWLTFLLVVGFVWLGGQIVRQGVSDAYLEGQPELAVLWQGGSSDALGALARERLAARDPIAAARLAAGAIRRSPLDQTALSAYALAEDRLGRPQVASPAMTLAGRLGWRDVLTEVWLFRHDLLALDFTGAFDHADALLRREDAPPPIVLRILAVAAGDPRAVTPLADRLAANPAWRPAFFAFLAAPNQPPTADLDAALLGRLAVGPTPPTDDELAPYLRALVSQSRFGDAVQAWRRLSPAADRAGLLYNGDFERTPGSTPFDWTLGGAAGWSATIADSPDGSHGKALNVQYDGVSQPRPLRELVVLAPGAYRLTGRLYEGSPAAAQSMPWSLTCAGETQPFVAQTPSPGAAGAWRAFGVDFTVPATNCAGQWLALAVRPSDRPGDISLWYDDLAIMPAGSTAAR